jgi:hypothetical protein
MIINVWSTPRTGSVWYSYYLNSIHLDSIYVNELFNRHHMKNYYMISSDGKMFGLTDYEDNAYYLEYFIDNGSINFKKVFEPRTRTVDIEEQHRFDLLKKYSSKNKTILHNHIDPINPEIRQYLMDMSTKNYYLYRKDKRAQLGSYVIAYSTKQFGQMIKGEFTDRVDDIDPKVLENLVDRIKTLDTILENLKDFNAEIIAYEDIEFFETDGFPRKQNKDYRVRLSQKMLDLIERLVTEYESTKNS